MTGFAAKVAGLTGTPVEKLERLAGGDLSQVLLCQRDDGRCTVAKGGPAVGVEAAMLRHLAGAGLPVPAVEAEHDGILLLEYVANDKVFSPAAWGEIGAAVRRLHAQEGRTYGWPADYRLGTVELDNRETNDWPSFWERRLTATASVLDRPWRERVAALAEKLRTLLAERPAPSLLHGDLWCGNILVSESRLAALIDPACFQGDREVDLAMLTLFGNPPPDFWSAYGSLEEGWEERRPIYQLFPALAHLRLFGASYAGMVNRLLAAFGC